MVTALSTAVVQAGATWFRYGAAAGQLGAAFANGMTRSLSTASADAPTTSLRAAFAAKIPAEQVRRACGGSAGLRPLEELLWARFNTLIAITGAPEGYQEGVWRKEPGRGHRGPVHRWHARHPRECAGVISVPSSWRGRSERPGCSVSRSTAATLQHRVASRRLDATAGRPTAYLIDLHAPGTAGPAVGDVAAGCRRGHPLQGPLHPRTAGAATEGAAAVAARPGHPADRSRSSW